MEEKQKLHEVQLDMGFKEPWTNKLKNVRYRVELFFLKIKTNSFLKNPLIWILSFLTVSLFLVQKYYYDNYFEILPKEIPLFELRDLLEFRLVENTYMFYILIISVVLIALSLILVLKTYYNFKTLSIMILGNLFLSIALITLAYIKIFGIYLF